METISKGQERQAEVFCASLTLTRAEVSTFSGICMLVSGSQCWPCLHVSGAQTPTNNLSEACLAFSQAGFSKRLLAPAPTRYIPGALSRSQIG